MSLTRRCLRPPLASAFSFGSHRACWGHCVLLYGGLVLREEVEEGVRYSLLCDALAFHITLCHVSGSRGCFTGYRQSV